MTGQHDFSPIRDHCIACALPITRWDQPCQPSTDTSPEAITEIERIANQ